MDTTTLIILASILSTFLFVIGVPVFLVLGIWIVGASHAINFTLANIPTTLFEGINFFGLLALPLFILTGDMISAAGIARRLTDFSRSALSWLSGGMAISTLGAWAFRSDLWIERCNHRNDRQDHVSRTR